MARRLWIEEGFTESGQIVGRLLALPGDRPVAASDQTGQPGVRLHVVNRRAINGNQYARACPCVDVMPVGPAARLGPRLVT